MKQHILTVGLAYILDALIDQQKTGNRIVAIALHYNSVAMLLGYLVIVEEQ
jgi:hypothetical protein